MRARAPAPSQADRSRCLSSHMGMQEGESQAQMGLAANNAGEILLVFGGGGGGGGIILHDTPPCPMCT